MPQQPAECEVFGEVAAVVFRHYDLPATILKIASQASENLFRDDSKKCKSIEVQGQLFDEDFSDTPSLIFAVPLASAELGIHLPAPWSWLT